MRVHTRRGARLLIFLCTALLLAATAWADDAPVFTVDLPDSASVAEGGELRLTVTVVGADLSYQWYKDDEPVPGMTGPDYTETGITAEDDGARYYCYVQNPFGGVSSTACVLSVLGKPVLTQDISASSLTVNKGDTITLSAAASGGSLTIRWFYQPAGGERTAISGQNSNTLSVQAEDKYNDADIFCQFTNDAGSVTTGRCRITVNGAQATPAPTATPEPAPTAQPPVVTKDPIGEYVDEGGMAIFIARADGTNTYKWRFVSPDNATVIDYDRIGSKFPGLVVYGGDTETITISNIPADMDGWKVACVFTGNGGVSVSGEARIQVDRAASTVSIIKQPKGASMEIDEQEDFFLTIEARTTKGGNLSYQWYSASTNSAAAMTIIPGATYNSYTPERVAGTKFYRVSVTLTDRGVTSEPIFSSICAVTFTDRTVHVHSYSDFWEANDISHWHQCTCGDHADEAFHTYQWTVLKAATKTEDGEQKGVCSVCGHETVQPIPAGSVTEEPEVKTPAKKSGVNVLMLAFGLLAAGVVIGAALLIRCVLKDDGEDSPGEGTPGEEKPKEKKTGKAKKKE